METCCTCSIINFQNNKLYYGPDARQAIGIPHQSYDESIEINPPNFEHTTWKCAFIQTRSNVRVLQPNTHFLYCKSSSYIIPLCIIFVSQECVFKGQLFCVIIEI